MDIRMKISVVAGIFLVAVTAGFFVVCFIYKYGSEARRAMLFKSVCWYADLVRKVRTRSRDNDPVMPAEYISWASPEKWKESCL